MGCYIKHLTPPLSLDLLFDSEPLTRYFNIRKEINSALETNRIRRLKSITNTTQRASHTISDSTTSTLSSSSEIRPSAPPTTPALVEFSAPNGTLLDMSKPANIMVWLQVSNSIIVRVVMVHSQRYFRTAKPQFRFSVILA